MERKRLLSISASVLAATFISSNAGLARAQSGSEGRKVNPDVNQSMGGTKSERTPETGTPLPEQSPYTGTVEKGNAPTGGSQGARQSGSSKENQTIHPDVNQSVGGTQSQRTSESGTPLPEKSPFAGTVEKGTGSARGSQDAQGMRRSGSTGTYSSGARGERMASQDIKEVQEALKDKGHDPGAIDGVMGPRTQAALREFQSSQGLQATGTLNDETAQKLGVERSAASGSTRGSMDMNKNRSGSATGR